MSRDLESLLEARLSLVDFAADHSLDEFLQKALDEVGELVGSPVGFYHFVDADQQTPSLQAWLPCQVRTYRKTQNIAELVLAAGVELLRLLPLETHDVDTSRKLTERRKKR